MSPDDSNPNLSSEEFERFVEDQIRKAGISLSEFKVQRLEKLSGSDGEYEIDVTARFRALDGDFLVLIECKRHKDPIKRDVVQILYDRLRTLGGHKGFVFSTAKFQSGAIEYAQKHRIALVQVADGATTYLTRSEESPRHLPSWVPKYAGWVVSLNEKNEKCFSIIAEDIAHVFLEQMQPGTTPK